MKLELKAHSPFVGSRTAHSERSIRICAEKPRGQSHLCVLEHAQVRVHLQGQALAAAPLVQLGCLVELALVGTDICQEQLLVVLSVLLPILQKQRN